MKKTLLALGTIATIVAPVASIVACSASNSSSESFRGNLKDGKQLKVMTLGDSVAHGDYTFQMSGSGTGFTPLIDGPARAASYQDYIFDELQRDGLMNENDRPDYKLSASGLRSGELAQWLKTGTYLDGMIADNKIEGTPEEQKAIQEHIDYHRHPYTYKSGSDSWWDDGLKDSNGKQVVVGKTIVSDKQKDQEEMSKHVKDSDVVLITIGGNDILKDIFIMDTPFPNLGTIDWTAKITELIGKLKADPTLSAQPKIKAVIDKLPGLIPEVMKVIAGLKTQITQVISGTLKPEDILTSLIQKFKPFINSIDEITKPEQIVFDKWFMGEGHKMLITVDKDKLKDSLDNFYKNLEIMSDEIHKMNPDANIVFTGYASPMMHFPKIFRNLAMPTYGQIAKLTNEFASKTDKVYFAPSSLQNWETDDPTDIYDNILVDPHPTLEGQGAMAKDILKVIDKIYNLNAKITDKEIESKTADVVESHKLSAPTMSEADKIAALVAGTYKFPYQTSDESIRGDLDYAYGVKPLPIEEITHAKVYFSSRIMGFLIDAITDSIWLNSNVKNPGDQSVPHEGILRLSDFTEKWGDNYLEEETKGEWAGNQRFVRDLGTNFNADVEEKFTESITKFIDSFAYKLEKMVARSDSVARIKNILNLMK